MNVNWSVVIQKGPGGALWVIREGWDLYKGGGDYFRLSWESEKRHHYLVTWVKSVSDNPASPDSFGLTHFPHWRGCMSGGTTHTAKEACVNMYNGHLTCDNERSPFRVWQHKETGLASRAPGFLPPLPTQDKPKEARCVLLFLFPLCWCGRIPTECYPWKYRPDWFTIPGCNPFLR